MLVVLVTRQHNSNYWMIIIMIMTILIIIIVMIIIVIIHNSNEKWWLYVFISKLFFFLSNFTTTIFNRQIWIFPSADVFWRYLLYGIPTILFPTLPVYPVSKEYVLLLERLIRSILWLQRGCVHKANHGRTIVNFDK